MNDRRCETMTLPDEEEKGTVLLCADGGLQNTLPRSSDPVADWIGLMETVEALCPKASARAAAGGVGVSVVAERPSFGQLMVALQARSLIERSDGATSL